MSKFTPKGKLRTSQHSILTPEAADLRAILLPVSTSGKEDSKLYTKVHSKWSRVKEDYKTWFALRTYFKLGQSQTTAVQSDVWVIHCLVKNDANVVEEKALQECLKKLADLLKRDKGSLHVSSLTLDEVPSLKEHIQTYFLDEGINVWSYTD